MRAYLVLVEQIIEKVLKPISNSISSSIGARYTSYFLHGSGGDNRKRRRFLHFYDRSQNRIQLHIDKKYLIDNNRSFDIGHLKTKFPVNETQDDYVIKINSTENLDFLADFLFKLYNK